MNTQYLENYQEYLDDCERGLGDLNEDNEPYEFDIWLEGFLEDIEFENSNLYRNEMNRLSEKD